MVQDVVHPQYVSFASIGFSGKDDLLIFLFDGIQLFWGWLRGKNKNTKPAFFVLFLSQLFLLLKGNQQDTSFLLDNPFGRVLIINSCPPPPPPPPPPKNGCCRSFGYAERTDKTVWILSQPTPPWTFRIGWESRVFRL